MKKFLYFILLSCISFTAFANGKTENTAEDYMELGEGYAQLKNYERAIYFYEKASKYEQYKHAALYNTARIYGLQNDWNKATPILKNLHKEEPDNILVLRAYAYGLVAVGKVSEGLAFYKQLAEADPENPDPTLDYAKVLVFAKEYDKAGEVIEQALTLFPSSGQASEFEDLKKKIQEAVSQNSNPNGEVDK